MKFKKLSCALTASLMIHTAVVLLAGAFWVTKTPQLNDLMSAEILSPILPPQPKARKALTLRESAPQKIIEVKVSVPRGGLAMVEAIGAQPSLPTTYAAKSHASALHVEPLHRIAPQLKPPNGAAYPDMYFKSSGVNPFLDTEDEHLSTFAMDVDTASYSVTRSYLTEGHLPPSEAVRVEEFVNAFKYDYTAPTDGAFAIHLEGAPSKFADSKRTHLLRIGLKGRVIADENRKDATLTFVIDVSGSMSMENRLGLVKRSLRLLVDQLRPTDKVGIVVYGSQEGWCCRIRESTAEPRFYQPLIPCIRMDRPMPKRGCASGTTSLGVTRKSIISTA